MARYIDIDNLEVDKYVTIWDCNCSDYGRKTVMAVDDSASPHLVQSEANPASQLRCPPKHISRPEEPQAHRMAYLL